MKDAAETTMSVVTLFDGDSITHSEGRARERRWI
jgi:hypothetical protein